MEKRYFSTPGFAAGTTVFPLPSSSGKIINQHSFLTNGNVLKKQCPTESWLILSTWMLFFVNIPQKPCATLHFIGISCKNSKIKKFEC